MDDDEVGYGKPPTATRFVKGRSGNSGGRPCNQRGDVPYQSVLGQVVTIREDGRERRVTAGEAFLLHLATRGRHRDIAAAPAARAGLEGTHASSHPLQDLVTEIVLTSVQPGSVGSAIEPLRMATKLDGTRTARNSCSNRGASRRHWIALMHVVCRPMSRLSCSQLSNRLIRYAGPLGGRFYLRCLLSADHGRSGAPLRRSKSEARSAELQSDAYRCDIYFSAESATFASTFAPTRLSASARA